jgi:hypothetical protein
MKIIGPDRCRRVKSVFEFKVLAVLLTTLIFFDANALSLAWNDGAGNLNWDTTGLNWLNGTNATTWNNSANESAVFGATGVGMVTLSTGITLAGMTFNNDGYYKTERIQHESKSILDLSDRFIRNHPPV